MSVTAVADIAAHDDPAYEWKAVLLLSVAFGLVGLDRWLVAPLAPQIMLDLGLNAGDINNLVAVLGIAWGLAAVLMGGLSDRIGRRRVMLPAMLVFSIACGLSGAAGGLLCSALLWWVIRDPKNLQRPTTAFREAGAGRISAVLRMRNIRVGMASLLCAMCGIFVLSANMPLYLIEHKQLDTTRMGIVTSALGFGGFVGQWALPAISDYFGRRPTGILGFAGGAMSLVLFMMIGNDPVALFGLLFAAAASSFGLLALITGPIAAEAAPPGMISTAAGLIIGVGEIFGGGLALVVAGAVINRFGIAYMVYLALGGLLLGAIVMAFLRETAPRLKALPRGNADGYDSRGADRA